MSIERWDTQQAWHATNDPVRDLWEMDRLQPLYVEIADTGAANGLNTVRHGMGRVPRGVRIVNAVLGASGDISWHRLTTDDAWTDQALTLRFSAANARVLLEVF